MLMSMAPIHTFGDLMREYDVRGLHDRERTKGMVVEILVPQALRGEAMAWQIRVLSQMQTAYVKIARMTTVRKLNNVLRPPMSVQSTYTMLPLFTSTHIRNLQDHCRGRLRSHHGFGYTVQECTGVRGEIMPCLYHASSGLVAQRHLQPP